MTETPTEKRIFQTLARIEAKLDALIDALADEVDESERPEFTLDGFQIGGERDQNQIL